MSNLPGSTISPLLEAHPDELILFSTNEQKTIRKTTRDESGWMDLGDYYVNSLSICRSSDFTKPAYVVLKDHIPTGRPYKVVGSILSVESLRNEHDSLSIHWQTTNVAHYNRHMLYVTTFKTSTLSEKYLIMWNGLALEQRRCSVPAPAFEQRSHDDEAVVATSNAYSFWHVYPTLSNSADNTNAFVNGEAIAHFYACLPKTSVGFQEIDNLFPYIKEN